MHAGRLQTVRNLRRWARLLCGLVAVAGLLIVSGCGSSPTKPMPLDKQVAKDSFTTFLESWKRGEQQAGLKDKTPSIIGTDPEWAGGAKLISYQVVDVEKDDGSNLHPTVDLVLQTAEGQQKSRVTYIVGTHPVITVGRQ